MKPVYQSVIKHDPDNGQYGDCFRACVCSILEISPENVPNFVAVRDGAWWKKFSVWLHEQGYEWFLGEGDPSEYTDYYIVTGKSPRGDWNHCVVYKDGNMVHDPFPGGNGVGDIVDYIWFRRAG